MIPNPKTPEEIKEYILSLKDGERMQETEPSSCMFGRRGTVYTHEDGGICIMWDKQLGDEGMMGTSVTAGARRVSELNKEKANLQKELDWLYANCKIIYWPKNGMYPIEHNMTWKKDSRDFLNKEMSKDFEPKN